MNESDSSLVVCVVLSTKSDDCKVDFQFYIMVSTEDETASEINKFDKTDRQTNQAVTLAAHLHRGLKGYHP